MGAVVLLVGVVAAPGAPASSLPARCRSLGVSTTDLGTLGGARAMPFGLNDRGQVVGGSDTPTGYHAFRWSHGRMTDLTPKTDAVTEAHAVNNRGQVLISVLDPGGGWTTVLWSHGVTTDFGDASPLVLNDRGQLLLQTGNRLELWDHGVVTPVADSPPNTTLVATDLNDQGYVTGLVAVVTSHGYDLSPFVWHAGTLTWLPRPSQYIDLQPVRVDEDGEVLVNAVKIGEFLPAALVWRDGDYLDIGSLRNGELPELTIAADLNRRGQIVGQSFSPGPTNDTHAFLWEAGRMTDLGTIGDVGFASYATGVSDRGHVIGHNDGPGGSQGFLWWCGTMTELDGQVVAVNDRGQVIAIGGAASDRAVLYTPRR